MPYQWGGERILQRNTDFHSVRAIVGHPDVNIRTDLREWITGSDMAELKRVLRAIPDLPLTKNHGDFDKRAALLWCWVAQNIAYVQDENSQQRTDFFQFPAETIALGQGDCEDRAFLLASLLIASGISEYCVRAVLGKVKWNDTDVSEGHAWVVYIDEIGVWRLLEPTLSCSDLPDMACSTSWPAADACSKSGARPWYSPQICLNHTHVWDIKPIPSNDVAGFVACFWEKKHTRKHTVK